MRRRLITIVAIAGLACAPGACTVTAKPVVQKLPISTVSPSVPATGPVPPTSGPHHYRPGAASVGDPLASGEGNGGYDVAHYSLSIRYEPTGHKLTGDDVVTAFATQDLSRFNLDFHGLAVNSVQVNGVDAKYLRQGDELRITPSAGIDVGTKFTVHVVYGGVPAGYVGPELGTEGFLPSGPGAIAQGEPDVAASWYPVNDHPSDKATYEINITTPSDLEALSNGLLVGKSPASGAEQTWHWVENQPMASYLATVMIGRYRITTKTDSGRPVLLAVDETLPKSYDAALDRIPEVINFLEKDFGPYPFDSEGGIIHADGRLRFALENQSLPVYSQSFFAQQRDTTWVLAHELAHQWYGDSVSVANWSDLWLNEGFATYAEWLWTEHEGGATPKQTFDVLYNGKNGQVLPSDPPAAPSADTLFGDSVYTRGAAALEALRIGVGDSAFFAILKGWAARKAYGNATTQDFLAYARKVSGKPIDSLLHDWLFGSGKPAYPKPLS